MKTLGYFFVCFRWSVCIAYFLDNFIQSGSEKIE